MSVTEPEGRPPTAKEITDSHVELALHEAGFTVEQAALLVDEGADWRKAVEYVGRGCPVDIALDLVID